MSNNMKVTKIPIHLDKERNLVFDLNAVCELEDKYGDVFKALEIFRTGSLKAARTFLWMGLVHEDPTLTEEQVGALITMMNIEEVTLILAEAVSASFPEAKNLNPSLTLEDIVKMTDGTGIPSTT